MKEALTFFRLTFTYKSYAILTIIFNWLYVIFTLVSMVLFIPFLQLIFDPAGLDTNVQKPHFKGIVQYCTDYYNYTMHTMVQESPRSALLFVCITVFAAFLLKNFFRYLAVWYQSYLRIAVIRDMKDDMYRKAMRLPVAYFNDTKKGDIIARMNSDVRDIEHAVVSILDLFFRDPIAVVIHVVALVMLSPKLTLISFVLLPLCALVISQISRSLKKTWKLAQHQNSIVFSMLEESLGAMRVIKAFNAIPYMTKRFAKINLAHQQSNTNAFRKADLSPLLNETIGAGVMLCLVWIGGNMILDKSLDSGLDGAKFITFIIVFSQLLRPIQTIANSVTLLNRAQPSLERIQELLNTDEVIYEAANPVPLKSFNQSVEVRHVTFGYRAEPVLKDVSFRLDKGKTIALVGESGSGKSTIADLIPRFYDVPGGEILIDGIDIKEYCIDDLHRLIGIVSQESILFNDTVFNNIAFGNENATLEEVMEAARIAHADSFITELENGYFTEIGERGNKLSGGQKQRLSIARAVLKNPSILILDEATSALDTESEKIVQLALEEIARDKTSLVIAHRLSTIQNADEILVLSKGEIVERGTHKELFDKGGVYFNLCTLQGVRH